MQDPPRWSALARDTWQMEEEGAFCWAVPVTDPGPTCLLSPSQADSRVR